MSTVYVFWVCSRKRRGINHKFGMEYHKARY